MEGFKTRALSIEAGTDFKIEGADINNLSSGEGQGNADDVAVRILADAGASITRGIQISNTRIGDCRSNGLWSDGRDVQLSNVTLFSTSLAGRGAAAAIRLGAGSQDVQLASVIAEEFGGAGRASFGLQIDPGAAHVQVSGLNANYVATRGVRNDSTDPSILLANVTEPSGATWSQAQHLGIGATIKFSPAQLAASPEEGTCAWDRALHKLNCFDGKSWRPAW